MAKRTTRLYIDVEYNDQVTDPESVASGLDILMDTACSTPGILDEYDNPRPLAFYVLQEEVQPTPPATDDRPGPDDSHGPTCAMRIHSASECTCGKADRMSEEEDATRTIKLPICDIEVHLTGDGGGSVTSDLKATTDEPGDHDYNCAIDGIEAMILACACAGIDIQSPAFLEAIESAVDGAANNT